MAVYTGTSGNDVITGLATNDEIYGLAGIDDLYGGGGNDLIDGGAGDDIIYGLDGVDTLYGGTGNDELYGGAGDDWLSGDAGNDLLDGGAGGDRFDYRDSPNRVNVNLATGIALDGWGGTDTLVSIAGGFGSYFDDILTGSDGSDNFTGLTGDDVVDGGAGWDSYWFGHSISPITLDMQTGLATGEGNDTLVNIEGIHGSNYSDTIYGNSEDNWFSPDANGAIFTPNYQVGGSDFIDGRGGQDIIYYGSAWAGVVVNLAAETAIDGLGNTDTLISIEAVVGSEYDDVITGDANDNWFRGAAGNDVIDGGAGSDIAVFRSNFSDAAVLLNNGTVTIVSGGWTDVMTNIEIFWFADGIRDVSDLVSGNQTIAGTGGADNVTGGSGADNLSGGAGDDEMSGGAGDDTIDGGDGDDVIVDGLGNDQITGGTGSDSITVLSGNNTVSGGVGSDFLVGGFQADNLDGGAGADVIIGDGAGGFLTGSDRITGGTGDDMMMGGGGADTFVFAINDGADTIAAFNAADVVFSAATGYSATPTGADFTSGIDHIELVGFAGIDASNVMGSITSGTDGAVFSNAGTSITFFGVDVADLSAGDFIFL